MSIKKKELPNFEKTCPFVSGQYYEMLFFSEEVPELFFFETNRIAPFFFDSHKKTSSSKSKNNQESPSGIGNFEKHQAPDIRVFL